MIPAVAEPFRSEASCVRVSSRVPWMLVWFPVAPEATNVQVTPFRTMFWDAVGLDEKVSVPLAGVPLAVPCLPPGYRRCPRFRRYYR